MQFGQIHVVLTPCEPHQIDFSQLLFLKPQTWLPISWSCVHILICSFPSLVSLILSLHDVARCLWSLSLMRLLDPSSPALFSFSLSLLLSLSLSPWPQFDLQSPPEKLQLPAAPTPARRLKKKTTGLAYYLMHLRCFFFIWSKPKFKADYNYYITIIIWL